MSSLDARSTNGPATALTTVLAAEAEAQACLAAADATGADIRATLTRDLATLEAEAVHREAEALRVLAAEVHDVVRARVDADLADAEAEAHRLDSVSDDDIRAIADTLARRCLAALQQAPDEDMARSVSPRPPPSAAP